MEAEIFHFGKSKQHLQRIVRGLCLLEHARVKIGGEIVYRERVEVYAIAFNKRLEALATDQRDRMAELFQRPCQGDIRLKITA